MRKILVILILFTGKSSFAQTVNQTGVVQYVNPFIGTGAVDTNSLSGSNFPGPTRPFAFVQLSPDTRDAPDDPASGYDHNDKTIVGFSHTHLSGTGVADLFDVLFMPTTGELKLKAGDAKISRSGYRSAFSHDRESARPGYYQVMLQDYNINAELTSTSHVGLHRYTFPASTQSHIVIDMDHSLDKNRNYWECRIIAAEIKVVNDHTIEGYRIITGWARLRKVYFHAEFSKPFDSVTMADGNQKPRVTTLLNGTAVKAGLNFSTTDHEQVLVKVALSSVSIENARMNIIAELPGWNFEKLSEQSSDEWEKQLSKIQIEGTLEQKQIFYTGLYHAFTQPNNIADVNGDYQATDMTIRNAPDKAQYSTFSLWDTYRAAHPLYTFIQPEKDAAFINTMIRQYETYGYLPIWQLWGDENYCMIGNHAIPVITDAILKGIPGIDAERAYQAVKASSTTDHPGSPFSAWEKYGYIPEDIESQSVSITVEMAYDDWCVAQLAKKLGKKTDYQHFMKRSANYKNLFNPKTGFFQARNKDGNWVTPFDPLNYGGNGGSPYTEANAWQYNWYAPQNVPDMINLMGGDKSFSAKLDTFFTLANKPGDVNGNASGFIGQYAHGNEPSHHIAYLYDYSGQPWKTQYYVAKVLNELYNNSFSGYAGNEDCGQMSAWYIFSSMGFYPVNPASGIYAIGSPVLKSASMLLANGKTFRMSINNPGKQNIYIQSVNINGKPYSKTYITQEEIMNGISLQFTMGKKPNKSWGIKAEDKPPIWGYKD